MGATERARGQRARGRDAPSVAGAGRMSTSALERGPIAGEEERNAGELAELGGRAVDAASGAGVVQAKELPLIGGELAPGGPEPARARHVRPRPFDGVPSAFRIRHAPRAALERGHDGALARCLPKERRRLTEQPFQIPIAHRGGHNCLISADRTSRAPRSGGEALAAGWGRNCGIAAYTLLAYS